MRGYKRTTLIKKDGVQKWEVLEDRADLDTTIARLSWVALAEHVIALHAQRHTRMQPMANKVPAQSANVMHLG